MSDKQPPFRTVHYRCLKQTKDLPSGSKEALAEIKTLEASLTEAIKKDNLASSAKERIVDHTDGRARILGQHDTPGDGFYGAIYEYEPESHQAILEFIEEHQENVGVSQYAPGQNREFVRNWVMFFVKGNHISFIQSFGFGGKMLEDYFDGFLKLGAQIPEDLNLKLKGQFDIDQLGRDKSRIKSVEVGDTVLTPTKPDEGEVKGEMVERVKEAVIGTGEKVLGNIEAAVNALVTIVGMQEHQARQILANRAEDAKLSVKSRVVATSRDMEWKQKFYSAIETTLHGMDHRDVTIRTATGTISGDKANLTDEQRFPMNGSLPEINEAWNKLRKVYERWRDDDKLDG